MPGRDRREKLAPRLAQQTLHAVSSNCGADRSRDGKTEPWLAVRVVVARKPVQDEVPARRRATAPVDGVEVLRPGEPVAALHCGVSGGEPLAPTRAPPLEDRAAAAGGHPRSEPVTSLAATNVRLIGAFHVVLKSVCVRGAASIDGPARDRCFPQSGVEERRSETAAPADSIVVRTYNASSVFHTCGQLCG